MKARTIHLMLGQLKTDFIEGVPPKLQRKFRQEHPCIDMKDCRTLIYEVAAKYGIEDVSQDVALELAKEDMEKEADAIMDFVIREDLFRIDPKLMKMKVRDLIKQRDASDDGVLVKQKNGHFKEIREGSMVV